MPGWLHLSQFCPNLLRHACTLTLARKWLSDAPDESKSAAALLSCGSPAVIREARALRVRFLGHRDDTGISSSSVRH